MPWPQRLNDNEGHIVSYGSDDVRYPITMTDYIVLITDEIVWLC